MPFVCLSATLSWLHTHPQHSTLNTQRGVAVRVQARLGASAGLARSVSAMTDKLYRFEGPQLDQLKALHRANLDVDDRLASRACLACTRAQEGNLWRSTSGQRECERTGICQTCWDALAADGVPAQQLQQQCDSLSERGVVTSRQWIMLSKARVAALMSEADARGAWSLLVGTGQLPAPRP